MGLIGAGEYYDKRYVGWWTRTFSSPKCPHCKKRMKLTGDSETTWMCKGCEWFTVFTAHKGRQWKD